MTVADPAKPAARRLELAEVRRRLAEARGPAFWRSLEELADTPEFEELLHREFPRQAAEWPEGVDRRRFLQLMGASLALGGLTACTKQPLEHIVPYVRQPEEIVPGRPLYYATGMTFEGYAVGLLAESHMGRPTKLEGSPEHPAGTGAADLFAQASILGLYDPDRSQVVRQLGRIRTWDAFYAETRRALRALDALTGARIRVLTGTVTSPSLAAAIRRLLERYPLARWHQYEPAGRHAERAGAAAAFGRPVDLRHDLSRAEVILSLDADFLGRGPAALVHARDFMKLRRVRHGTTSMNRLYAAETSPTLTGTMADHRLPMTAAELARFALALAAELGVEGVAAPAGPLGAARAAQLAAIAADLESHAGRSLVMAGEFAAPAIHVLAHAVNEALGNVGATVVRTEPVEAEPVDQLASLAELVADMRVGEVDVLLILGGNPVYDAPADLGFTEALNGVGRRVRLGLYEDETSAWCQWHLPEAHYLESWGDARAGDGTVTLQQPLIEPLYGGRTAAEVVAGLLAEDGPPTALDLVRGHWEAAAPEPDRADFEATWRRWLHQGWVPGTAAAEIEATVRAEAPAEAAAALAGTAPPDGLELWFRPDPTVHDGRFANNGWLQECPKPLTKLTWDNAAHISPALALRLGLESEQMVAVELDGRTLELPVWVLPGHPDGAVTLHLGYGRERAGRVGSGTGFDAYRLRTAAAPWTAPGATLRKLDRRHPLASTQMHQNIPLTGPKTNLEGREAEKRHLVRAGTLAEFRKDPEFAHHMGHTPDPDLTLYPLWEYEGYAWGLAIDLSACTGCNACVVACQSENNIAVVGKQQVQMGREMHWLRIDRYFEGGLDAPRVHHQPVMCMHCEQAPCEVVCPVAATVHSSEGLNDMIYNRCVGTRYCSNNCPYKVRRFNFLLYSDFETPTLELMRNPDVTVRSRGVMEKCSYCVQRINYARIDAEREGRKIRDGEILTACQQSCPTGAIVFGDIGDPESRVARWKAEPLNYGILEELNTRPRTTYLAKVRNPNPALEESETHAG